MKTDFEHTAATQRVADFLREHAHPHAPVWLNEAAHTAQQAADAQGVALGQIAKSVIFKRLPDEVAVLIVTAGDQRVDEKKVKALVCNAGQKLSRADADFVKAYTGFSIGGVSPVGHTNAPVTLLDESLLRFDLIWAAAGHPNAVFQLNPRDLQQLCHASFANVAQSNEKH